MKKEPQAAMVKLFGSMLFIAVFYTAIFIFVLIFYGFFTIRVLRDTGVQSHTVLFWITTGVFIAVEIFIMYLFYKKIYSSYI